MTVRVVDAAKYLADLSGFSLSNLPLQKILYLADMVYTGETGTRLVNENFEAWDYGPVLPSLYHRCKGFGAQPLPDVFWDAHNIGRSPEAHALRDAWAELSTETPGELVENAHWEGGAWNKKYQPGVRGIVITTGDMVDEFNRRADARAADAVA